MPTVRSGNKIQVRLKKRQQKTKKKRERRPEKTKCPPRSLLASSSAAPVTTGNAAVGKHVAVGFGPERGMCHGKGASYFGAEVCHLTHHAARADGEEADLNAEERAAAVELARPTEGSPCAPMECTPLRQCRGRGLFGMAGKFSLFPLPVSEHEKGPGAWRTLGALDPLDAAGRGLALGGHERWDGGRPFFPREGWEVADGQHGGASEGRCGRGSRKRALWRGRPTSARA
jgi:hypothetical protein